MFMMRKAVYRITDIRQSVVPFMDGLVSGVSRVVIAVALAAIVIGVWQLTFSADEPEQTRTSKVLALIHDNWRAMAIIAVPLFYTSIRDILGRVTRVGSLEFTPSPDRRSYREEVGLPEQLQE